MAKKEPKVDTMFDGFTGSASALGRARQLFRSSPPPRTEDISEPQPIEIGQLLDNPYQPRGEIRADELEGLVASIRLYGFRGSLLGRPSPEHEGYIEIAYGHRRREAAREAGLGTLPVEIAPLTNQEMAALAAVENIQREDLSPVEEGRLYQLMIDQMGYTQVQVAKEIGKSRGYVENRLRAAAAPSDVQEMIESRPNTLHYVPKLTKLDEGVRREVVQAVLQGRLTGEGIEDFADSLMQQSEAEEGKPEVYTSHVAKRSVRQKYSRALLDVALRAVGQFQRHAIAKDAVTTDELVKMRHIRDELSELITRYDIVD